MEKYHFVAVIRAMLPDVEIREACEIAAAVVKEYGNGGKVVCEDTYNAMWYAKSLVKKNSDSPAY